MENSRYRFKVPIAGMPYFIVVKQWIKPAGFKVQIANELFFFLAAVDLFQF
jgi:hypothetical protein